MTGKGNASTNAEKAYVNFLKKLSQIRKSPNQFKAKKKKNSTQRIQFLKKTQLARKQQTPIKNGQKGNFKHGKKQKTPKQPNNVIKEKQETAVAEHFEPLREEFKEERQVSMAMSPNGKLIQVTCKNSSSEPAATNNQNENEKPIISLNTLSMINFSQKILNEISIEKQKGNNNNNKDETPMQQNIDNQTNSNSNCNLSKESKENAKCDMADGQNDEDMEVICLDNTVDNPTSISLIVIDDDSIAGFSEGAKITEITDSGTIDLTNNDTLPSYAPLATTSTPNPRRNSPSAGAKKKKKLKNKNLPSAKPPTPPAPAISHNQNQVGDELHNNPQHSDMPLVCYRPLMTRPDDWHYYDFASNVYGTNFLNTGVIKTTGLRPIFIDGNNVAMGSTNGRFFSVKGLKICIDYFKLRGHEVTAVVPQMRKKNGFSSDPELLKYLETQGAVVFTPSRYINGKLVIPYDDRFIVQLAAVYHGIVVSCDNFRDLLVENPFLADTINNRVLNPTFMRDMIMFPSDPLGRNGPSLDQFLRFPRPF